MCLKMLKPFFPLFSGIYHNLFATGLVSSNKLVQSWHFSTIIWAISMQKPQKIAWNCSCFNATNPVLHTALKASKVRRDFFHELYSLQIGIIVIYIYIYIFPIHNNCLQYIMVGLMYVLFSEKEKDAQIEIPYIILVFLNPHLQISFIIYLLRSFICCISQDLNEFPSLVYTKCKSKSNQGYQIRKTNIIIITACEQQYQQTTAQKLI